MLSFSNASQVGLANERFEIETKKMCAWVLVPKGSVVFLRFLSELSEGNSVQYTSLRPQQDQEIKSGS